MSTMQYEDLDETRAEFRLLTIKPSATSDSPIECFLETFSLNDNLQYLALSYVWGDPKIRCDITVNGIRLPVTTNLAAALRQLRTESNKDRLPLKNLPSFLWIDAICIDQSNMPERSSQVCLMGKLYRRAKTVIAWLGPEGDGSALAMDLLLSLPREITLLENNDDKLGWLERWPVLASNAPWNAMNALWARDYWRRTWVMQEIVLANEIFVMCGEADLVPWDCIWSIQNWVDQIKITDPRPSALFEEEWHLFAGNRIFNAGPLAGHEMLRKIWHGPNFEKHVKESGLASLAFGRELDATNPRDKVYGLLGLSTEARIVPDYSKPVRNLYIEAASEYLRLEGLTRTLNLVRKSRFNGHNLPSWVPDWSVNTTDLPMRNPEPSRNDVVQSDMGFHAKKSILRATGSCLSKVLYLQDLTGPSTNTTSSCVTAWKFIKRFLAEQDAEMYVTGIPPLQAVMRLLIEERDLLDDNSRLQISSDSFLAISAIFVSALLTVACEDDNLNFDETCHEVLPGLGLELGEAFAISLSQRLLGQRSPVGPWKTAHEAFYDNTSAVHTLTRRFDILLTDNRIFQTSTGHIGIGPDTIEAGDMLYVLKGCNMPIILRSVNSYYEVVGTCHVQGLMDGELKTIWEEKSNLEWIEIH
jgi:hypothetical protein